MEPLAADLAAREILLMAVNTAEHIKPSKPPGTLSIQNEYKVKAKIAVHQKQSVFQGVQCHATNFCSF